MGVKTGNLISMKMSMGINDAADHLGVSPNTVRRHLSTRLLKGSKIANKWWVQVDVPDPEGQMEEVPPQGQDNALVEVLQGQVKALAEQLEHRTKEISELHQLLAAHSLNAGQNKNTGQGTPWWAFWRWERP